MNPDKKAPAASEYRSSLDLMRFVGAIGIVWAHMFGPGPFVGPLSLSVFLIITAFLSAGSLKRRSPAEFIRKRAVSILQPWLVWSAIYFAADVLRHGLGRSLSALVDTPLTLLIGTSLHLWFLPFVFLGSFLIVLAKRVSGPTSNLVYTLAIAAPAAALALILCVQLKLPAPLGQWAFSLPVFLLGIVAAQSGRLGQFWVQVAYVALVTALTLAFDASTGLFALVFAAVCFQILWYIRGGHPLFQALGSLAMGVYLIHPLFILIVHKAAPGLFGTATGALLVFAVSMLAVMAMRKSRLTRWLV